jgi:hypothetical protein
LNGSATKQKRVNNMKVTKRFYKENGMWYIDLPEFLEAGLGNKNNLLMVDGADTLLDILSLHSNSVVVEFGDEPFQDYTHKLNKLIIGMNKQLLDNIGHAPVDYGAYYTVEQLNNHQLWLCPVTEYVFNGGYPENIYLRVVN